MAAALQQKEHLTQSLHDSRLKLEKSRRELSIERGAMAQSWKVRYVATVTRALTRRCRPAGSWFLTLAHKFISLLKTEVM